MAETPAAFQKKVEEYLAAGLAHWSNVRNTSSYDVEIRRALVYMDAYTSASSSLLNTHVKKDFRTRVQEYLNAAITHWASLRHQARSNERLAETEQYIDAYQSMNQTLFGTMIPTV